MPIWLRRFTYTTIEDYFEKQAEEQRKQASGAETLTNKSKIAKPPTVKPTYTTKASKK